MAFDPSLVSSTQKYTLLINRAGLSGNLSNVPIAINLGPQAGINGFAADGIFSNLGANFKRLSLELGGTQLPVLVSNWLGLNHSQTPAELSEYSDNTVKGSWPYSGYDLWDGFDPALSLTGPALGNSLRHSNQPVSSTTRVNVDLGTAKRIGGLRLDNFHDSGSDTNQGIKEFEVYGSNTASDFTDTSTNASLFTDGTMVKLGGLFTAAQHTAADQEDPQYFPFIHNQQAYRYYIIRVTKAYGSWRGFRHIELLPSISSGDYATLHTVLDEVTAGADQELVLSYDNSQDDNDDYVRYLGDEPEEQYIYDGPYSLGQSSGSRHQRSQFTIPAGGDSDKVVIRLTGGSMDYEVVDCWIGKQASSGNDYDFDGNQVRVTFDGGRTGKSVAGDINALDTPISDAIDFPVAEGDVILIAVAVTGYNHFASATGVDRHVSTQLGEVGDTVPSSMTTGTDSLAEVIDIIKPNFAQRIFSNDFQHVILPRPPIGPLDELSVFDALDRLTVTALTSVEQVRYADGVPGWKFDGLNAASLRLDLFHQITEGRIAACYRPDTYIANGDEVWGGLGSEAWHLSYNYSLEEIWSLDIGMTRNVVSVVDQAIDTWDYSAVFFTPTSQTIVNGLGDTETDSFTDGYLSDELYIGDTPYGSQFSGYIGALLISGVDRSADWSLFERRSMTDTLLTFSGAAPVEADDSFSTSSSSEPTLDTVTLDPGNCFSESFSDAPILEMLNPASCYSLSGSDLVTLVVDTKPLLVGTLELPALECYFRFDNLFGTLELPALELEATIAIQVGLGGELELPALEMSGTIGMQSPLSASLELPALEMSGTISISTMISADMELPALELSGIIGENISLSGELELPALELAGSLTDEDLRELQLIYQRGGSPWRLFV